MMKKNILAVLSSACAIAATSNAVWADAVESFAIVVTAPRPEKGWTALSADEMAETPAGTTPLKLLGRLPGVSQTGSEDFGAYEWGNDLNVRGFSAGQIGWMLDDIPLGSTHYWYNNGLDLHRAVSTENLRTLALLPGSGTAALASSNALGAGIVALTDDPAETLGSRIRLTGGSHRAARGFVRIDTGRNKSGGAGYVSFATLTSDKWKGMGGAGHRPFGFFARDDGDAVTAAGGRWGNYHDQLNAKWVQSIGPHRLTLYANVSDKRENDYADLTVADYRRFGPRKDNWTTWQEAISGDETVYFGSAMSWRRDLLAAATLDLDLGKAGRLVLTPYRHTDEGNGDWHMPTVTAGSVTDMVLRRSGLDLQRHGLNLRWNGHFGGHRLGAGFWVESRRFDRRRHAYELVDWRSGPAVDFGNVVATLMDRRYETLTRQLWLQDRYTPPGSAWTFSFGGKLLQVDNRFHDRLGRYADNRLTTESPFLPSAGITYRLSAADEVYANTVTNINAKPETVFTQSVYDDRFKAERSRTLEFGWRHLSQAGELSLSLYDVDYKTDCCRSPTAHCSAPALRCWPTSAGYQAAASRCAGTSRSTTTGSGRAALP